MKILALITLLYIAGCAELRGFLFKASKAQLEKDEKEFDSLLKKGKEAQRKAEEAAKEAKRKAQEKLFELSEKIGNDDLFEAEAAERKKKDAGTLESPVK